MAFRRQSRGRGFIEHGSFPLMDAKQLLLVTDGLQLLDNKAGGKNHG